MSEIWALVRQAQYGGGCNGLALVGLFSSIENCKRELIGCEFGAEQFKALTWEKHHDGFWNAHGPGHGTCYALVLQEVDECTPRDLDEDDEALALALPRMHVWPEDDA